MKAIKRGVSPESVNFRSNRNIMILGDKAIKEYLAQGKGVIGYKEEHINPNSVDLTLNENYSIYRNSRLDCRAENEVVTTNAWTPLSGNNERNTGFKPDGLPKNDMRTGRRKE